MLSSNVWCWTCLYPWSADSHFELSNPQQEMDKPFQQRRSGVVGLGQRWNQGWGTSRSIPSIIIGNVRSGVRRWASSHFEGLSSEQNSLSWVLFLSSVLFCLGWTLTSQITAFLYQALELVIFDILQWRNVSPALLLNCTLPLLISYQYHDDVI